jgi:hypothetical protein
MEILRHTTYSVLWSIAHIVIDKYKKICYNKCID